MTICDHAVMKLGDAFRSGFHEQEREYAVEKTGEAVHEHGRRKGRCRTQMLEISLADRGRMFSKCPLEHGCLPLFVISPML